MADLLPVDTTSASLADLTPPIARLDVPLAQLETDLQLLALKRERAGLLAEQRHQLLDLDADFTAGIDGACPYSYLRTGGQS